MTDATTPVAPKRRQVTIRQRIALGMVLLVASVLGITGAIILGVEQRSTQTRIDSYLERTKEEFRVLATQGVDPVTGEAFRGPSELLRTFLSRTVLRPQEGEVGIVEGEVRWVSSDDVQFRPEDDQQLVDHALPLARGDVIVVDTVRTVVRDYRMLVVPVKFSTSEGALLHVYDLDSANEEILDLLRVFVLASLGGTALAAVAAWLLVGRLLRPVEELRRAAESISEHDLTSRVPVRGHDDLTRLSTAINHMLDRVQNSVEGQRQLLDDVGHELRTPLTIVRGHLELTDPADEDDVRQTRELAIDELDRMGELVGDLLLLAKANQSDFVAPQWYSLATLTDQVLEKARALGQRSWRLRHIESTDAWIDPSRITQAWLQLAANAVKYSEPGSPITFASELVRGEVHLSVADRGVGIHADELERIRARFGRGRSSFGEPGAGLGLSIVESIVHGHDGRLEIDSEPGVGSTFTIVLPLRPPEATS